jgi:hypothetical protein
MVIVSQRRGGGTCISFTIAVFDTQPLQHGIAEGISVRGARIHVQFYAIGSHDLVHVGSIAPLCRRCLSDARYVWRSSLKTFTGILHIQRD